MTSLTHSDSNQVDDYSSRSDFAACRKLIRHGSHSFFIASLALPRRIAIPAIALYAFCRVADDLIDDQEGGPEAITALNQRLDAIYSGIGLNTAEDRAMSEVVHYFDIPRSMPDALIEGLTWDAAGRNYESLSDLYDYASRVAGCVGAMMSLIMGTRDERAIARACDLGVAMQLTNIARDIGEDARMNRLYLPRDWFSECGLDPDAWLLNPTQDRRVTAMCKRLLDYADILYNRADAGVALLPLSCRPGIRAARLIYSDIGRQIAKQGLQTVEHRAVVPKSRKLSLLLWALVSIPWRTTPAIQAQLEWPPLKETKHLLEDIESVQYLPRIEWLINLFTDMSSRPRRD